MKLSSAIISNQIISNHIIDETKSNQEVFDKSLRDAHNLRHQAMLAELHARCEANKNALREERFWNEVMEEAQALDFPY